jgi:hypothetical protein
MKIRHGWIAVIAFLGTVAATPSAHGVNGVDSQVTDAVTQANVKVLGDAPAMPIGTVYQTTAQSMGAMLNDPTTARRTVQNAQSLTTQGITQLYSIDTAPSAPPTSRMASVRQDSEAKVLRKIDAMAQRLDECGEVCVLNLHVHTAAGEQVDARGHTCDAGDFEIAGTDISTTEPVSPAQLLATCIVARMETHSKVDVEGVGWVIPDAPAETRTASVTSVDMYIQRLP